MGVCGESEGQGEEGFVGLFGPELLSDSVDPPCATETRLAGKRYVMIYFSAYWSFTPKLSAAYQAAGPGTEIVFVSWDNGEDDFNTYYGEMPWLAVPFTRRDIKVARIAAGGGASCGQRKLMEKFQCQGIPLLVVLDGEGKLISKEGRTEYLTYLPPRDPK